MKSGIWKPSVPLRIVLVAALTVVGMAGVAGTGVAHAQTNEFCSYDGTSGLWCLDDWADGGANNTVAIYGNGYANEEFAEQLLPGRCGGGYVEDVAEDGINCPFKEAEFDQRYVGYPIVQLQYQGGYSDKYCIVTGGGGGGLGILGGCNSPSTGTGGGNGSIFIDHGGYMINLYWSNQDPYGNNASCMELELNQGEGGAGSFVFLDQPTVDGCTLWNSQL